MRGIPEAESTRIQRLASYPDAGAFVGATPARWIRHTLDQLQANGGRYRATTAETKRDWHNLLEYNRHDCLALRHIALKSVRELDAWRAYHRTRFCVDARKRRVCFRVGGLNRRVQALLDRHHAKRFAFITAWNPGSVVLSRAENRRRQTLLLRDLGGYATLPGEGIGDDPAWAPEESLMVFGISRGKAVALGQKHGQLAIVFGKRESPAELVSCAAEMDATCRCSRS